MTQSARNRWLALGFLIPVLLAACGQAATGASSGMRRAPSFLPNKSAFGAAVGTRSGSGLGAPAARPAPAPPTDRHLIQTAYLRLRIPHGAFWSRYNQAVGIAQSAGGYLSGSTIGNPQVQAAQSGSVVLEVPAPKYSAVLRQLRGLGTPTALQLNTEDVSGQYVDLNAQLKNALAEQAFYLKLMAQARSIADEIAIENQLTQVTATIQQLEGQLNYLNQETVFSSITVDFAVAQAPAPRPNPLAASLGRYFATAGSACIAVVGSIIVAAGFLLPLLLLAAVGLLGWRFLPSRLKPSFRV